MCNATASNRHHHANHFRGYHSHRRRGRWEQNFRPTHNGPPANVRELDDEYELHLFAPGYEKGDFLIALIDQTLSISVKDKKEDDTEKWKRKEYGYKGFVREFELNDTIDKSSIEAKYENGVLILTLPKLEGFETKRKDITIS